MSILNNVRRAAGLVSEMDNVSARLDAIEARRAAGMVWGFYKLLGLGLGIAALVAERDRLRGQIASAESRSVEECKAARAMCQETEAELRTIRERLAFLEAVPEVRAEMLRQFNANKWRELKDRQMAREHAVDEENDFLETYGPDGRTRPMK